MILSIIAIIFEAAGIYYLIWVLQYFINHNDDEVYTLSYTPKPKKKSEPEKKRVFPRIVFYITREPACTQELLIPCLGHEIPKGLNR